MDGKDAVIVKLKSKDVEKAEKLKNVTRELTSCCEELNKSVKGAKRVEAKISRYKKDDKSVIKISEQLKVLTSYIYKTKTTTKKPIGYQPLPLKFSEKKIIPAVLTIFICTFPGRK